MLKLTKNQAESVLYDHAIHVKQHHSDLHEKVKQH